jgi:hypothetical protein
MLTNCHQKKSVAGLGHPFRKGITRKKPSYQIGFARNNSLDDYLNRLAFMKEQGNLVISGRRIC